MTTTAVTVPRGATITTCATGRTMAGATRTTCGRLRLTVVPIITGTYIRVRSTFITTIPATPFRAAVSWRAELRHLTLSPPAEAAAPLTLKTIKSPTI